MHPVRRRRALWLLLTFLSVTCALTLVLYALRQNINAYYTPSELVELQPVNTRLRVGGMVLPGSVQKDPDDPRITFTLTDYNANVHVRYEGILPDLFREGQGLIVTGVLVASGWVHADTVLAKHDETYMPPEVARSLKEHAG